MTRFFYFLFLFPAYSYACSCVNLGTVYDFQQSEFVAKAKIMKVTPDRTNSEYHDAVIKIISLYKGEHIKTIKIHSSLNSSCSFLPTENSTWIIFAQRWQGILSFGYCSGSIHLDRTFDSIEYPNAAKNYGNTIKLRESVISFLSKNKLSNPNPSLLHAYNSKISSLKGYKNKNSFAVFQVDVNPDLSIATVNQLKKFQNRKLNKLANSSMKTDLKFANTSRKPLTKTTSVIVFCFFYQDDGINESFLSFFDV